jgi:hypothetical protein
MHIERRRRRRRIRIRRRRIRRKRKRRRRRRRRKETWPSKGQKTCSFQICTINLWTLQKTGNTMGTLSIKTFKYPVPWR